MVKKVCHMTSAHSRHDVRIFEKECSSLAKYGYDITLIVNDDIEDEVTNDVKIVSTKFKPKNRIDRLFNSKKIIFKKAIEIDADIYHFHDPDLIIVGNNLKKLGKKVIFDSHEDVPAQILDKQWIPGLIRGVISYLYKKYEIKSARKYDAIISVTPHIVRRLSNINSNTIMITNYPIIDIERRIIRITSNSICFAGGISEQWCHDKIIKSLENIDGIEYLLAGDCTSEYMELLKSLPGWDKVNYIGKVSHEEVRNIYSKSIAGVALNFSSQAKDEGTLGNTKLFEFMEAGLPVICTNYKLWKEIIDEYQCGIYVNPNNIYEISSSINYILANKEKAYIMGQNGRKAVEEKYNWNTQEEILLKMYDNI